MICASRPPSKRCSLPASTACPDREKAVLQTAAVVGRRLRCEAPGPRRRCVGTELDGALHDAGGGRTRLRDRGVPRRRVRLQARAHRRGGLRLAAVQAALGPPCRRRCGDGRSRRRQARRACRAHSPPLRTRRRPAGGRSLDHQGRHVDGLPQSDRGGAPLAAGSHPHRPDRGIRRCDGTGRQRPAGDSSYHLWRLGAAGEEGGVPFGDEATMLASELETAAVGEPTPTRIMGFMAFGAVQMPPTPSRKATSGVFERCNSPTNSGTGRSGRSPG